MNFMAKSKIDNGVTLIATNTELTGDIKFADQLYINGRVYGNISADPGSKATVIISEEGTVNGEIRVPNVIINGTVEGNVYASGRLELAAKARVSGSVYYTLIEMQLGAMVDGQLVHDESLAAAENQNVHPFPADQSSVLAGEQAQEPQHS
jgi:cytoskeletal protein CcmA (bactofilin family)